MAFNTAQERRERQRSEARRAILDAAGALLVEGGIDGFSMRSLAARCGYALPTIYHHFGDKPGLLEALLEERFRELLERLRGIPPQGDPGDTVREIIRSFVDFGLRYPTHYQVLVTSLQPRPDLAPHQPRRPPLGSRPARRRSRRDVARRRTIPTRAPRGEAVVMTPSRWLLLAALGLALVACGEEAPLEEAAQPVVVQPVVARDLEERIEATGELVSRNRALVSAEVGGRITEVIRDEGSQVPAGDTVLTIDPERRRLEVADARARLAEAMAAAAEAQREHARIRRLYDEGVASQARLEQTETQLNLARSRRDAARARLGVARRALADATVRAPFAGVIAERRVSAGEFVQSGTPLFELVSLDPIEAEFHLPEADASRVREGQEGAVRVAPYPGEVFRASVTFVSPTIDPETHTLLVRGALANADRQLRPGLFAAVDLGVALRPGVPMIPEEAVLQRADGQIAFRLRPDLRVERLVIQTGIHRQGEVEVTAGVDVGDRIVVRGHYALVDGVLVQPRTPEGKPATDLAGRPETAATP
jgi:membrane fusion protein (multidrug efflux system)